MHQNLYVHIILNRLRFLGRATALKWNYVVHDALGSYVLDRPNSIVLIMIKESIHIQGV